MTNVFALMVPQDKKEHVSLVLVLLTLEAEGKILPEHLIFLDLP